MKHADMQVMPILRCKTVRAISVMNKYIITALLIIVAGCAAPRDVFLPKTTPFDADPKARAAYLEGYRNRYHAFLAGDVSVPGCTFGRHGIIATARELGGWAGQSAAMTQAELHERERQTR